MLLDALFGRDRFLNELIWAYDYGAKTRRRWPTKHDTILVYVKDPRRYWFDSDAVDREPYMAPGLVTPEKAARGKLPTDVWWHTIVPTTGREKTGYPTQKPEGILRRIIQASTRPGDRVLDFFAGSGTTGAVASALGREAVLVDDNPEADRRDASAGSPMASRVGLSRTESRGRIAAMDLDRSAQDSGQTHRGRLLSEFHRPQEVEDSSPATVEDWVCPACPSHEECHESHPQPSVSSRGCGGDADGTACRRRRRARIRARGRRHPPSRRRR